MADIFRIGSDLDDLTVGEPHAITGLIIDIGDENYFIAGDDTGFIVEVTCPWVTGTEQTQLILDRIKGITFTPYEASEVIIDPSAELGDYFMCPNFSGGIFSRKSDFFGTMDSDLALPYSEEEDHEYTYIPPETRNYKREINTVKEEFTAEITATAKGIRSDVEATYATKTSLDEVSQDLQEAVEDLNGAIEQAAGDAYANAVQHSESYLEQNALKISAGVATSFGMTDGTVVTPEFHWALTARAFKIYTNNEQDPEFAFTVDEHGANPLLSVRGYIVADGGVIGDWVIEPSNGALYNGIEFHGYCGKDDPNSGSTGMGSYGTTWAFWSGDGRFRVDETGNVVCQNISVESGGGSYPSGGVPAITSEVFSNQETDLSNGVFGGIAFGDASSKPQSATNNFGCKSLYVSNTLYLNGGLDISVYMASLQRYLRVQTRQVTDVDGNPQNALCII